jgi:hypothetical protein
LFAHVRTGKWASIMPAKLAETLGLTDNVRSIPIVEPAATHAVGLIVPHREPMTPLITALVTEARALAKVMGQAPPVVKNTSENKSLAGKPGRRGAKAARASRRG